MAALGEERGTGGGGVEGVLEGVEKASVGVGFSGIGGDAAADMGEMVVKVLGGLSDQIAFIDFCTGFFSLIADLAEAIWRDTLL